MNTIKLSPINFRGFEVENSEERARIHSLAKAIRTSYEAAYYAAKALGYKNVSEMEQAMFPENS